jgi:hypothetical protein
MTELPSANKETAAQDHQQIVSKLGTLKDAVTDLFMTTSETFIQTRAALRNAITNSNQALKFSYIDLACNAVAYTGLILSIYKITEWKNTNRTTVQEASDSTGMFFVQKTIELTESATALFSTINSFTRHMHSLIECGGDEVETLKQSSICLASTLEVIGTQAEALSRDPKLGASFLEGIGGIAALYDEYLQDLSGVNPWEEPTTVTTAYVEVGEEDRVEDPDNTNDQLMSD